MIQLILHLSGNLVCNIYNYIVIVFILNYFLGFLPSTSSSTAGNMSPKKCQNSDTEGSSAIPDTRIEDGKLLFEKRWYEQFSYLSISLFMNYFDLRYHRGQPVFVEGRQMTKFPAVISAIGNETVSH